jgi:hypothetical protein
MAVRISRSESALESASSAVLDGAGLIGDSIGITGTQYITTAGTTPGAPHFTIGAISTEEVADAAELAPAPAGTSQGAAEFPTVPAQRPDLSTEAPRLPEDTLHPAVRAASARAPSAATTMEDRQGAIRHAEAPAWVAEQRVAAVVDRVAAEVDLAAAVAGVGNRSFVSS